MKVKSVLRRASACALLVCASALASLSAAQGPKVTAVPVEVSATASGEVATVSFKLEVTNGEEAAMTLFSVVFADDATTLLDDIGAGKTVTSPQITRSITRSEMKSANAPLKVTFKFVLNGTQHEVTQNLSIPRK